MALIGRIKDNKLYIKGEIIEGRDKVRIKDVGDVELNEIIEDGSFKIDNSIIKLDEVIEDVNFGEPVDPEPPINEWVTIEVAKGFDDLLVWIDVVGDRVVAHSIRNQPGYYETVLDFENNRYRVYSPESGTYLELELGQEKGALTSQEIKIKTVELQIKEGI